MCILPIPHLALSSTTNEYGPVGALQSFRIAENGTLSLGDTTESGGNGPTYTERLSTGEVTALNVSRCSTSLTLFMG